jgi:hypothetical protein
MNLLKYKQITDNKLIIPNQLKIIWQLCIFILRKNLVVLF